MARTTLDITTDLGATALEGIIRPTTGNAKGTIRRLAEFLRGSLLGVYTGVSVNLRTGAVPATATLTFTNDPTADETFVLCGVTFTGKASGASGAAEWNITTGGSNAADAAANAASVVTMVNAHTTVGAIVLATSSLGVVTFTAKVPGIAGNGLVLSDSLTNATSVTFAGGSDGTLYSSLAIS